MSLVLGRNRRNREIRKLLVSLSLHLVIFQFKKRLKLHPVFTTCFHSMKYISPWQRKIQIPVALIKPRLLNPLKTTCVVWPWPPPSHHLITVCPQSVSAALSDCALRMKLSCSKPGGSYHPYEPPVVLILSNKLLFCLCFYGYLLKRQRTYCFVDKTQIDSFSLFQ